MKDSEVKQEYDKLSPEYEIISCLTKTRKKLGISQAELAKTIGTDQARISKLEKGREKVSSFRPMTKYCQRPFFF
ncbi:MAG: helix-turn-helix domain-containing protein [Cetobacterium sp.]